MPTQQSIIDNLEQYTPEDLAGYIQDGTFSSLNELKELAAPDLPRRTIKAIEEILANGPKPGPVPPIPVEPIVQIPDPVILTPIEEPSGDFSSWLSMHPEANEPKTGIPAVTEFLKQYPGNTEANRYLNELYKRVSAGPIEVQMRGFISKVATDKTIGDPHMAVYTFIIDKINKGELSSARLLEFLREDSNLLNSKVIAKLLNDGIFSYADLYSIYSESIVNALLNDRQAVELRINKDFHLVNIAPGYTEVYFWGLPSSGKTCCLGGLLSVANSGILSSIEPKTDCSAYAYMQDLADLFKLSLDNREACVLPPGTATTTIAEMRFELTPVNDTTVSYPLAFIDLAGEIVEIMGDVLAGEDIEPWKEEVIASITNILRDNSTKSRKIHFFVVEYGAHERYYKGKSQSSHLENAAAFINQFDIFKNMTDCVYIIVTKSDKAVADAAKEGMDLNSYILSYLQRYYNGFCVKLQQACKRYEINGGKFDIIPFTLGNVGMQSYCEFDSKNSQYVIEKILSRAYKLKKTKWAKFQQKLSE